MTKPVASLSPAKEPADQTPLPDPSLCRLALEWEGNWWLEIEPRTGEWLGSGCEQVPNPETAYREPEGCRQ